MTINELATIAGTSVLKSVATKNDLSSIVGFINLGLIELYKRFPISTEEKLIALEDGIDTYIMPSNYMWTVAAYGEVPTDSSSNVNILAINEEDNPLSVNTVGWNKVQVPVTIDGAHIAIIYVSAPEIMLEASPDTNIPIPPQMIEALLLYVGYLGNEGVDGDTPTSKGASQYAKFEASCARIEAKGMFTADDLDMSDRIFTGGWK